MAARGERTTTGNGSSVEGLMGLPPLMRAWRAAAGQRMGLGKPLPQKQLADRVDVSVRWIRNLESGLPVRPTPEVLERLADVLGLDRSQRATLYLYTSRIMPLVTEVEDPAARALRILLDTLMPHPATITSSTWDILGYNAAAADWFPWVQESDANVMRWFLLDSEARDQLSDWHRHASDMIGMLRVSHAQNPDDPEFAALLEEVTESR
ncbi:helix-turn-helix transcriptional regulator [Streptomyces sp. YIM 98790]|uniref:helix-turn-helix transcriptional regulator n=1 Tax=Streptomyces sp. YIM 98790 TaxID=2689077 RepID=UPI001407DB5D|nr:helix-turn-helix transcriptional regulator [Streptomyces sp. YIM 98790]